MDGHEIQVGPKDSILGLLLEHPQSLQSLQTPVANSI